MVLKIVYQSFCTVVLCSLCTLSHFEKEIYNSLLVMYFQEDDIFVVKIFFVSPFKHWKLVEILTSKLFYLKKEIASWQSIAPLTGNQSLE